MPAVLPPQFINWMDYKVWYPLGRHVGHSIYPGMQVAAVTIHESMKAMDTPATATAVELLSGCSLSRVAHLPPQPFQQQHAEPPVPFAVR